MHVYITICLVKLSLPCWRFGLFPFGGQPVVILYVPSSLPWDAPPGPSHSGAWGPPVDQREAGCGATSLPRQTQPRPVLMSWKVGPQLLALTGAGCRGRAPAPGPQLGTQTLHRDIKGPARPSGASLLHLLPHFIPLFCSQSPCPSPQSWLPWDG